jgi:addiction module RelE/StbE family toxin
LKVLWTRAAELHRIAILDYIASDNPRAAIHMDELFEAGAASLEQHPKLGKPGVISGTREYLPHSNYRMVYKISGDTIWILALLHTSRLWPPSNVMQR